MNDRERIKDVFEILSEKKEIYADNPTLLSGSPGVILFLAYYYQYSSDRRALSTIETLFERITTTDFEANIRYSDGLSGLLWLCLHIEKQFGLSIDLSESLTDFFQDIKKHSNELLQIENLDFLHGMLGLQMVFEACEEEDLSCLIDQLIFNGVRYSKEGTYWLEGLGSEKDCINTSMAHGLAAHINYLASRLEKQTVEKKAKMIELIQSTVRFLKSLELKDELSLYPSYKMEGEELKFSRLAWCYGDLSIACAFLYCSIKTNDSDLWNHAILVAARTIDRKSAAESGVLDLGFCHGSSGLMQMYSYFYRTTKVKIFQDASNYWKEFTVQRLFKDKRIYKAYRGAEDGWQESYGLLDGLAGIGLVLISSSSPELSSWEEVFYLKKIRDEKIRVSPANCAQASSTSAKIRL